MKTIRNNVFETNSSSTHSVTLYSLNEKDSKKIQPLVEHGVLYPDRLSDYSKSYGDVDVTLLDNKDKKAAWFINACDEFEDREDFCDGDAEDFQTKMIAAICQECGYTAIDSERDYVSASENSEIDDLLRAVVNCDTVDEAIEMFKSKIISKIILNDKVGICDGDYPMY